MLKGRKMSKLMYKESKATAGFNPGYLEKVESSMRKFKENEMMLRDTSSVKMDPSAPYIETLNVPSSVKFKLSPRGSTYRTESSTLRKKHALD